MPRLVWSAQASADLNRIHEFIGVQSRSGAERAVGTIVAGAGLLARFPKLGQMASVPTQRTLILPFGRGAFLMRYSFNDEVVKLLWIRHSSQLRK